MSLDLKIAEVGELRIVSGSLFHSFGPARANARLPSFFDDRMVAKRPRDEERRLLLDCIEQHGVTRDEIYGGAE